MREIINSKYCNYFLAGLLFIGLCAWFSLGFNHPDEHFQVLEFANYKLGFSPGSDLPWEFRYKMRAAILPAIVYLLAKPMISVGLYNPFTLAFILRLLTGFASWFISCRLCLFLSKRMKTPQGEKALVLMSMFLWFIPYLSVRFSSENISGLILLYTVYMLLNAKEKSREPVSLYLIAGFLLGMAFFMRIQIVFAIIGLAIWLIAVQKIKWKYLIVMALAAILAIGMNIGIDYWLYGEAVFTPYNYYFENIVLHRSADFGTFPIWYYLTDYIIMAIPPLSLVLLFMFLTGSYKNLKSPLVWIIVPLIVAHSFIGHKEMRFLFPCTFIFIYITALGFDYFFTKPSYLKLHKYIYAIALIITIPAFIYRTFAPADEAIPYFKYLYNYASVKQTTLLSLKADSAYNVTGQHVNFYKNPNIKTVAVENVAEMTSFLNKNHLESALFLNKVNIDFKDEIPGYRKVKIYSLFPNWLLHFNINHWEDRTHVWSIYELSKMQ